MNQRGFKCCAQCHTLFISTHTDDNIHTTISCRECLITLQHAKRHAWSRKRKQCEEDDTFNKLWDSQSDRCFFSGIEMKRTYDTAIAWRGTIHRLESRLGFIATNTVLCCAEFAGSTLWSKQKVSQLWSLRKQPSTFTQQEMQQVVGTLEEIRKLQAGPILPGYEINARGEFQFFGRPQTTYRLTWQQWQMYHWVHKMVLSASSSAFERKKRKRRYGPDNSGEFTLGFTQWNKEKFAVFKAVACPEHLKECKDCRDKESKLERKCR